MKLHNLIEVLMAAHVSHIVDSPFPDRGGIMLVAPPGQWKSRCIGCLESYSDCMVLSDINAQALNALKPELESERYHTLAFPALEKIYERASATSANAEGTIKALVAEGMSEASFEDHRILGVTKARCMVIAGMVPSIVKNKISVWIENGFARRFIWASFQLADPRIIIEAIHKWERHEFDNMAMAKLPLKKLDLTRYVDERESRLLEYLIRAQYGQEIPLILMKKIYCVLKYKFKDDPKLPKEIIEDFGTCLGRQKGKLIV